MITKNQAMRLPVFVSINPETGECDHFYRSRGVQHVPAEYRAGKCKTWKRRPLAFRVKLTFGGFNRNRRNYTVASVHGFDPIGFEPLCVHEARKRFGFGPVRDEIDLAVLADRLRDAGEEREAERILGNPVPALV